MGLFKSYESYDHEACYFRTFRGTMFEKVTMAKGFLDETEKRFAKNKKVKTSMLLVSLISKRYITKGNIREYIMEMSHLASKLKALKLELFEDLLMHLVLISLLAQFSQFKVSYNCQKDKWSLNEFISYCVQLQERLKQEKAKGAHLATTSKDKNKNKKRKKDEEAMGAAPQKKQQKEQGEEFAYYFYRGVEHKKKQCTNYHT